MISDDYLGLSIPDNKFTSFLGNSFEKTMNFFDKCNLETLFVMLLLFFWLVPVGGYLLFLLIRGLKHSLKYLPATMLIVLLIGANSYLLYDKFHDSTPKVSNLIAAPAQAANVPYTYSKEISSLKDTIYRLKTDTLTLNYRVNYLNSSVANLENSNNILRNKVDSLQNLLVSSGSKPVQKSIKKPSPVNNTIVYISTSPNAYAYHRSFGCANNRTKYSVISVTTTEAREKYHRSPCGTCHPR